MKPDLMVDQEPLRGPLADDFNGPGDGGLTLWWLGQAGFALRAGSLRLLVDKSRLPYLPLDRYDVDMDLARGFPADVCRRWCVLPFDRMSKSILVATANPFNQQAAKELAEATTHRLLWYLASPNDIVSNLRKAFR